MEILNTEIIDNAHPQIDESTGNEFYQPSEISILVEIELDGKNYHLDFQSTTTCDYGAYSSSLAAYDGTDDYDALFDVIDDEVKFNELLAQVKNESNAQKQRDEYVNENYEVDTDYFGGMDANSEVNRAVKK